MRLFKDHSRASELRRQLELEEKEEPHTTLEFFDKPKYCPIPPLVSLMKER